MTDTMRRRYRDLGERFQKSAEAAAARGDAAGARRMFLSAAREYLRVASESGEDMRSAWVAKADRMETLASRRIGKDAGWDAAVSPADPPTGVAAASGITLDDVAGLAAVKQAVTMRIIYPFRHPETSRRFHKHPGGGVLMFGPPGTGKTLIARAVAGEIGAGFFSVGCSDIFSKYVGETEKNMRRVFEQAAACDRAVLFLDEVEALLGRRGGDRSPVLDRLVPEFLSLTDGIGTGEHRILVLAATNRPWDIDEAALREGRLGQLIYVGLPDRKARRFILDRHLADVPLSENIDLDRLEDRLEGFSGADIAGLCREATDLPYLREIETGTPQELTAGDLEQAIMSARKSVTPAMLERFSRFAEERGIIL